MFKVGDVITIYRTTSIKDYREDSWKSDVEKINKICCYIEKFKITKINKRSYSVECITKKKSEINNLKWSPIYSRYTQYDPEKIDGYSLATEEEYDALLNEVEAYKEYYDESFNITPDFKFENMDRKIAQEEKELEEVIKKVQKSKDIRDNIKKRHDQAIEKHDELWNKLKESLKR